MASNRIEIVKELRALEAFCTFKAVRSGEEQERFLKDYLADVQEFPLEAISKACGAWRKSGATKFPTPGQLLPLIKAHLPRPPSDHVSPWRTLTDEEYADLSLPAKVRHCQILAREARSEAIRRAIGEGWDRNVASAPPSYRHFMALADGHDAEAKRLRGYLRSVPMAAE